MRRFTDAFSFVACRPRNDLLDDRQANEAYCLAQPGEQYAVYFTDGGAVSLLVPDNSKTWRVRWMDISKSQWHAMETMSTGNRLRLKTPGEGHWAVLIEPVEQKE